MKNQKDCVLMFNEHWERFSSHRPSLLVEVCLFQISAVWLDQTQYYLIYIDFVLSIIQ